MFVLVKDDKVLLGPNHWSQQWFQNGLWRECAISTTLPSTVSPNFIYEASDNVRILPITNITKPEYDKLTEQIAGPYYTFDDNGAQITYNIVSRSLENIKSEIKRNAAAARYDREVGGLKVEIQSQLVPVTTTRGERDVYSQQAALQSGARAWKFASGWLTVTDEDFQTIASEIAVHVQQSFDWESDISNQVDATDDVTTLKDIATIVSEEQSKYVKRGPNRVRNNDI